jgi:hypothetical protein
MPTFVGRSAELGLLRARLDEAAAGRPRTVVLEGTAGVGKSALVHAFSSSLDPASVLSASGDEAETFLPFGALMQLLGSRSATWPDPFAAGRHVLEILDQRHRDQPTVFVVDDAHLADTQSLTALTFALRRLQAGSRRVCYGWPRRRTAGSPCPGWVWTRYGRWRRRGVIHGCRDATRNGCASTPVAMPCTSAP